MVSALVALIGIGLAITAFVSFGGVKGTSEKLLGSDFSGKNQSKQSGQVTTDSLQNNPSIPIPQGSQTTVATIQGAQILRTDVNDKRKLNQNSAKPQIKTVFDDNKSGGSSPQAGFIPVTSNLSNNAFLKLNADEVGRLRAQPFTKQEQQDILNLQTRFNNKSLTSQKVSTNPVELVQQKREQAFLASKVFDSKTVQNPNFNIGLPSDATQGDIDLAIRQRQERDQVLVKVEENKVLQQQRQTSGEQIIQTIAKSGMNQKQFLFNQGVNLQGSDLNAKAIARLRERGLI